MAPTKRNPAPCHRSGVRKADHAGLLITSKSRPHPAKIQARHVSRRFAIPFKSTVRDAAGDGVWIHHGVLANRTVSALRAKVCL
jgi:hypothetical protein